MTPATAPTHEHADAAPLASDARQDGPGEAAVRAWVSAFDEALQSQSPSEVTRLFHPEGYWRDLHALTWDPHTVAVSDLEPFLAANLEAAGMGAAAFDATRVAPRWVNRGGVDAIEGFIRFRTRVALGSGVVRLVPSDTEPGQWLAWNLFTTVEELIGHEERVGLRRPQGSADSRKFGGPNWLDRRLTSLEYADREPEVVIVGGGQAGLSLAARLGAIGVDALVVDQHERVGDNWRKRYHALTLHNSVWLNDLPYMPNPPTWPVFVPKDKVANWFEAYVEAMEINFWKCTRLEDAQYDDAAGAWSVQVTRNGQPRVLRPQHLVIATGISGAPRPVEYPGLESYTGTYLHSSSYQDGHAFEGRKAIVIGTGNSGHDVAQDLYASGVDVTMVQRGSSTVVSVIPGAFKGDELFHEGNPVEDSDLIAASIPYPVLIPLRQELTRQVRELDRDMLDGLEAIGFKLDFGDDGSGHEIKYMRRGGGYYMNVGCSDLLIERKIGLVQQEDVDRLVENGLRLKDGTVLEADLVVFALGFLPHSETVRAMFGDETAARLGPVWGFDEEGEVRNVWRRTAQKGLWFMAGNFVQSRFYSRPLAVQLKAALEGISD
jgi:cation diffusion facilitator CzcD-associated flavoprotein CzcO